MEGINQIFKMLMKEYPQILDISYTIENKEEDLYWGHFNGFRTNRTFKFSEMSVDIVFNDRITGEVHNGILDLFNVLMTMNNIEKIPTRINLKNKIEWTI